MVSSDITNQIMTKHTQLLIDGCEAAYTWEDGLVSVGNKKVQQPKNNEWIEGWQRCIENIYLNFIGDRKSDAEKDALAKQANENEQRREYRRPSTWT